MFNFDFVNVNLGGMPVLTDLKSTTTISQRYYYVSLILQLTLFFIFGFFFIFTAYRSSKKMKHPKFIDKLQPNSKEQQGQKNNEQQDEQNDGKQKKQTDDNLIYKFDDEQKKQGNNEAKAQEIIEQDQQTLLMYKRLFKIEEKMLIFIPNLIGSIIAINSFTCDFISCICLGLSFIMYLIFNVFECGKKIKLLSLLYFLPIFGSFVPIFRNVGDFTI